jgi:ABC-type transport system involved in Fe-S cluster assembly fused permease/ATPase subunit
MPNSQPDASSLLEAAIKYLDEELSPALEGYHRFQTRVTINALATVRRELMLRDAHEAEEHARLVALLGHDGATAELNAQLCERIRAGEIAQDDSALRAHVRASLRDALAINNPKWLNR